MIIALEEQVPAAVELSVAEINREWLAGASYDLELARCCASVAIALINQLQHALRDIAQCQNLFGATEVYCYLWHTEYHTTFLVLCDRPLVALLPCLERHPHPFLLE